MTSVAGPGPERQRILIVEDSKTHRRNLRDALADEYELHWAINARDALALAFTKRPNLILLDINIEPPPTDEVDKDGNPILGKNISGLEVCRQLKKSILKDTPIIVLTASKGFIPRIKGKLAHANEYLTKPIETQQLLDFIYKYLGSPRVRGRLDKIERDYGERTAQSR
jgi:twitching motility two-component system response regulator PilG